MDVIGPPDLGIFTSDVIPIARQSSFKNSLSKSLSVSESVSK